MTFPFGETVTLVHRSVTGQDVDGNDLYSNVETTVGGTGWDPGTSTENVQGGDLVIQLPRFFLPSGTVVSPLDAIRRANGRTYEVVGEPGDYRNPMTGWEPGVVVNVRRVTG